MQQYKELLTLINQLRDEMTNLINKKDNLLDPEVIELSQVLDRVLNKYYILSKS